MEQPRDEQGKFIITGEEERKVRGIRLTDSTWNQLEKTAKQRCITRTELIEELLRQNSKDLNQDDRLKLQIVEILTEALTLKANAGGAIKKRIREVLTML